MIHLQKIERRFGDTRAVDGVTFHVSRGEVFGLLGPNGAGKTTTVNLLSGLLEPDAGTVRLGEWGSPRTPACRAHLGLAPQALALYEALTGRENLRFFGRIYGISRRSLEVRVEEALAFTGLEERAGDRVSTYSGGMKRRLNLAAALIHHPPILLLDEPTVGVDPQTRNALFENIRSLASEGRTILYTTHYMEEAERLCDRVAIMDHGRILALDTVEGLLQRHGKESVLVVLRKNGREERIPAPDPLEALLARGREGDLVSFRVERPDLEQVFLNLTGRRLRDG